MANPSTQDSIMSSWHLAPGSLSSLPNRDAQSGPAKSNTLSLDRVIRVINSHAPWSEHEKADWVAFVNAHYKPKHWLSITEQDVPEHLKAVKTLLTPEHKRSYLEVAPRKVAVGNAVDMWLHFYSAPNQDQIFEQMTARLLQNGLILLTAPPQAGKSTYARALADVLIDHDHAVAFVDLQRIGKNLTAEHVLSRVADRLAGYEEVGAHGSSVDSCSNSGRRGFSAQERLAQLVDGLKGKCSVFIDGGDRLQRFPQDELSLLLNALGSFQGRQPYSMGCIVIGTPQLADFLLAQPRTSPFTKDDVCRAPQPFAASECENLLQQLLHELCTNISMRAADLAASIYTFTQGHRGTVGLCLREVEIMLDLDQPVTAEAWAVCQANVWAMQHSTHRSW